MSPIQQMLLGVGAVAKKTYVDDVFSTYLWEGTGSTININNGINLSQDGGMVWVTNRDGSYQNLEMDTELGVNKSLALQGSGGTQTSGGRITAFNNNGFTMGSDTSTNNSGQSIVSTTFKKTSGFFTIVKYTGNGTAGRQLSHDLGCVPGIILIRRNTTSNGYYLYMYHRDVNGGVNPENYNTYLQLSGYTYSLNWLNNTAPTASVVTLGGEDDESNSDGVEYLAYLFAGGSANSQALARSVSFDGSDDELYFGSTTDFEFGTGDFTWEAWIKPTSWTNNAWNTIFMVGGASQNGGLWIGQNNSNNFVVRAFSDQDILTSSSKPDVGVWTHVAVARSGTTLKLFYNGIEQKSVTTSYDFQDGTTSRIANDGHNQRFTGKISNLRIVKGTAVYTSNFNPSDSLTNITNTKLLCCNDASTTGSTVTPTTITASGGPTASADSPVFTDVAANVFGDGEDQPVVKVGAYEGDGNSTGPEIYLGFEPQMILLGSNTNGTTNSGWRLFDSMRGIVTGGNDATINLSESSVESSSEKIELTPTGFKIVSSDNDVNEASENYLFLAIRRPDGYCGKPPELGTGVFAMDTGSSSSTIPAMDSSFVVDMALYRKPDTAYSWHLPTRLTGTKQLYTNNTSAETTDTDLVFDSNVGWAKGSTFGSDQQSWMWKRHAGFDVVAYKGDNVAGRQISHSLSKIPEMIWVKNSDRGEAWRVYHKGLNGGTTPHNYGMKLNTSDAESAVTIWNQTAPTSTHFTINADSGVNHDGEDMRAFLFASVDGISKVGSYTGSDSDQTITLGFQPRFLIVKAYNQAYSWLQLDTTRGWATSSGNNSKYLFLELNWDQDNIDVGYLTSTGFVAKGGSGNINESGASYIYYAHA